MGVHEQAEKTKAKMREVFFKNRHHYNQVFTGQSGDHVLRDLAKFCHLNEDLYRKDEGEERYLLGERRVMLRILSIIKMTDEQIFNLTQGPSDYDT